MKKIYILCLVILLNFCSCSILSDVVDGVIDEILGEPHYDYSGYKEVIIEPIGKMKVPENWNMTRKDDDIYFKDNCGNTYFAGHFYYESDLIFDDRTGDYVLDPDISDIIPEAETGKYTSEVFSNGVIFGKTEFIYKGKKTNISYLTIKENGVSFYLWAIEGRVEEEELRKISYSFTCVIDEH